MDPAVFTSVEPLLDKISGDRPKVGVQSIVYELDTLRHKARHGLEQLSLVILSSCANKSQTTSTEQCQVAAGSIWDGPMKTIPKFPQVAEN